MLFLPFPETTVVHARYPHNMEQVYNMVIRDLWVCVYMGTKEAVETWKMAKNCVFLRNLHIPQMCLVRACVCVSMCIFFSLDKVRYPSLNAPRCIFHYPAASILLFLLTPTFLSSSHQPSLLIPIPHTFPYLSPPSFFYVFLPFMGWGAYVSVCGHRAHWPAKLMC